MRKKLVFLAALLALSLILSAVIVAITPTTGQTVMDNSNNFVDQQYGCGVKMQLPQGVPEHPTVLDIHASHIYQTNNDTVNANALQVMLWIPQINTFMPVAIFTNNSNQTDISRVKATINGTPIWNTNAGMENFFVVEDQELQVEMDSTTGVLVANLTKGANISLNFNQLPDQVKALFGNPGDLSFELPPLTLMFTPIGDSFPVEESTLIPSSGWTMETSATWTPAWVQVQIPAWIAGTGMQFVGYTGEATVTYTPPSPPA